MLFLRPLSATTFPSACGNVAATQQMKRNMTEDFETRVKRTLVSTGLRHRNRIVRIRATGNGVDTTRRAAWFGYEVHWNKPPSRALLDDLQSLAPIPPHSELYASDIDRILLVIQSQQESND
jgi:hypothetical protein